MTVTIELPSDIEAGLLAQAQAQAEGLAVSDYVQHLVVEKVAAKLDANSETRPAYELSPEGVDSQIQRLDGKSCGPQSAAPLR